MAKLIARRRRSFVSLVLSFGVPPCFALIVDDTLFGISEGPAARQRLPKARVLKWHGIGIRIGGCLSRMDHLMHEVDTFIADVARRPSDQPANLCLFFPAE